MCSRQYSERVVVLIPCEIIDPRCLIAGELEYRLSLPVHDPDDLVLSTNGDKIPVMTPS